MNGKLTKLLAIFFKKRLTGIFSDFNFERDDNNKCVLVPGLQPLSPICDGNTEFYYTPSG